MDIKQIFKNNQNWVQDKLDINSNYFKNLSEKKSRYPVYWMF